MPRPFRLHDNCEIDVCVVKLNFSAEFLFFVTTKILFRAVEGQTHHNRIDPFAGHLLQLTARLTKRSQLNRKHYILVKRKIMFSGCMNFDIKKKTFGIRFLNVVEAEQMDATCFRSRSPNLTTLFEVYRIVMTSLSFAVCAFFFFLFSIDAFCFQKKFPNNVFGRTSQKRW